MKKITTLVTTLLLLNSLSAHNPALPSTTASTQGQIEAQTFSPQAFLNTLNNKVEEHKKQVKTTQQEEIAFSLEQEISFCNSVFQKSNSKGFNADELSPSGLTALQILMICYFAGMPVTDHVRLLLEKKASVDVVDEVGRTPLWYLTYIAALATPAVAEGVKTSETAENSTQDAHSRSEHLELIELMLAFGANPHRADLTDTGATNEQEKGLSPVRVALELQALDILELFEKHGWIKLVKLSDEETEALVKQMQQEQVQK